VNKWGVYVMKVSRRIFGHLRLVRRLLVYPLLVFALAALGAGAVIRERQYEGNVVRMTVAGPASLLGKYRKYWRA
jgi:hypothetical protein